VGGHELLLLAHGVQEADRMAAEADQPDRREGEQGDAGVEHNREALARPRGGQRQERKQQPGGDLHTHPRCERGRRTAVARSRPGTPWRPGDLSCPGARGQRQRERKGEQDQSVVVGAAHRQHEQHGVQPNERCRPAS
jgi:hypothetical protein